MMSGRFLEYNWRDIERLIFADAGLTTEEDRRGLGDIWISSGLDIPEDQCDTCIRVKVYDKPSIERLEDHVGKSR